MTMDSIAHTNDSSWAKHWQQITNEFVQDDNINSWFLMGSPWPIVLIFVVYLQFILKTGPEIMKNRPPFKLRAIILCYNIFQIFLNALLFVKCLMIPGFVTFVWKHSCNPLVSPVTPQEAFFLHAFNIGSWWFLIIKVLDLLDTVFFVLCKKQSHVSFLHVYHHSSMMLTVWFGFKYIRPLHTTFPAALNCLIHMIMYAYYSISILIPGIGKKNMLLKKVITRMQIAQFVVILGHCLKIYCQCSVPRSIIYLLLFHVSVFLLLFINFYMKQYVGQKSERKPKEIKKQS